MDNDFRDPPPSPLRKQVGGWSIHIGPQADLSNLNIIYYRQKQGQALLRQFERESLIDDYAHASSKLVMAELAARGTEILLDVSTAAQIDKLKEDKLAIIGGLETEQPKYQPVSYSGMGAPFRPSDLASAFASLVIEGLHGAMGATNVRVRGIHAIDDDTHYISVVTQGKDQADKPTSMGVQDLGFHGDGDGFQLRMTDVITIAGQIADVLTPTLFSSLEMVLRATEKSVYAPLFIKVLKMPLFLSDAPLNAASELRMQPVGRPVIRDGALFIHPSTRPFGNFKHEKDFAFAQKALDWLRMMLAQTSIGFALNNLQFAKVPNSSGKHAVWSKALDARGNTDRQFLRGYATTSFSVPDQHVIEAPLW